MVGFSRLARQAADSDRCGQYLGIIEESARVLMNMVNNILDMSRIESGQLTHGELPIRYGIRQSCVKQRATDADHYGQ